MVFTNAHLTSLCPGDVPIDVDESFIIDSGFAPGAPERERKPKWRDAFVFNKLPKGRDAFIWAPDHCLFREVPWGRRCKFYNARIMLCISAPAKPCGPGLGCAHGCYPEAKGEPNPYYKRDFYKDSPDYRDPVSGQINRFLPPIENHCPNPNRPLTSGPPPGRADSAASTGAEINTASAGTHSLPATGSENIFAFANTLADDPETTSSDASIPTEDGPAAVVSLDENIPTDAEAANAGGGGTSDTTDWLDSLRLGKWARKRARKFRRLAEGAE